MTRKKASQQPAWTPLGAGWWDWRPLALASPCTRLLWLALYSSAPARRLPPGLWQGGHAVMAEVARLELGIVEQAFGELEDLRLVEGDPVTRIVRLTALPDRLDRAHNGDRIRGWWKDWRTLTQCTVRDSHVETLRTLVGHFTQDHQEAWDETFATVPTPLRVPARPPLGHGAPHGGGHRVLSPHVVEIAGSGHGVPHGGGHRQGEGEGILRSSLPDSGSGSRSSREITNSPTASSVIEDPSVAREVDAARESWERRRGGELDLAHESVRRYGPRAAVQDGPSASSERFK